MNRNSGSRGGKEIKMIFKMVDNGENYFIMNTKIGILSEC